MRTKKEIEELFKQNSEQIAELNQQVRALNEELFRLQGEYRLLDQLEKEANETGKTGSITNKKK